MLSFSSSSSEPGSPSREVRGAESSEPSTGSKRFPLGGYVKNDSLQLEQAADQHFLDRQYKTAMTLNFMAKTPQLERISNFASLGYLEQVVDYVELLFSTKCAEIARGERMHLATLLVNCLVNLYADKQAAGEDVKPMLKRLLAFLKDNMYYDDHLVIRLLVNQGLYAIAETCAQLRMNFACLIENMSSKFHSHIELFSGGDITACAKKFASDNEFIKCFTSSHIIRAFLVKPSLLNRYLRILTNCLPFCSQKTLKRVAELFNPRAAYGQLLLNRVLPRVHSQYPPDCDANVIDFELVARRDLLNFYVFVLLLIYRFKTQATLFFDTVAKSHALQSETAQKSPTSVLRSAHRPVLVAGGQFHAAVIVDGLLYTWGKTSFGRLGVEVLDVQSDILLRPTIVPFFSYNIAIVVRSVACGASHTLMLTDYGLYACGLATNGQLGIGRNVQYSQTPCLIEALISVEIEKIACGQYHSLALTTDGELYTWGWGVHGQLGLNSIENVYVPAKVEYFKDIKLVEVAGGYCHSLVLDSNGIVYTFGSGLFGQLGLGSCSKYTTPQPLLSLPEPVTLIATQYFQNIVRTAGNAVYTWGAHPQGGKCFPFVCVRCQVNLSTSKAMCLKIPHSFIPPQCVY